MPTGGPHHLLQVLLTPAAHRGLPDALLGLARRVQCPPCSLQRRPPMGGAGPADDAHVPPRGLAGQLCRAGLGLGVPACAERAGGG